jgi:hypothetical protein
LTDLGVSLPQHGAPKVPKKSAHEKYYWFPQHNQIEYYLHSFKYITYVEKRTISNSGG